MIIEEMIVVEMVVEFDFVCVYMVIFCIKNSYGLYVCFGVMLVVEVKKFEFNICVFNLDGDG